MTHVFDILIIGGGIAGLSVAASLPAGTSAILLEAEDQLGFHSSGRSASLFPKTYGPKPIRDLTVASENFFTQAHPEIEGQPIFSPRGALMLGSPDQRDQVHALAAIMGAANGQRIISAKEAADLHPMLKPDQLGDCFLEPEAQSIDVDLLMTLFRKRATAAGVEIKTKSNVKGLSWQGQDWRIETKDQIFNAQTIINCAGAWADQVGQLAGAERQNLTPKRRSVGVVPIPEGMDLSKAPMVIEIDEKFYFKPMGGTLLISPAEETPVEPHDAFCDDEALAEACWHLEQVADIEVTRMLSTWAGLRTFAPDGLPVIKRDPIVPNFIWSAGQGGYGIQTAPAWAQAVVSLL